jgi:hypothetical protein
MSFSPVFEVQVSDPAQQDDAEKGQGVVRKEIKRDQGTGHPVHPGEGQEQAHSGDNRQSRKKHVFSSLW